MIAIAAVDLEYGIGKDGKLLAHIPEDLKRFKRLTKGKTVVMGRKTLESLPGGNPLPERENIVLTRDKTYKKEGVVIADSIESLLKLVADKEPDDVMVIGGGEIYRELLPYCTEVYLTVLEHRLNADSFFPKIAESHEWALQGVSQQYCHDFIKYHFEDYRRI